ncbi:mitochondrial import protein Pam17 [Violaceomyces palustris]|uniref:Mitochondrial import protein Pam17 n=1 Tax=Violaceomyces palustris TaxID=1673888 RepID=A0ACD0NNF5_9BASI|nr:mitochondrial import protein Pam17 [Violaceomyces palustris]
MIHQAASIPRLATALNSRPLLLLPRFGALPQKQHSSFSTTSPYSSSSSSSSSSSNPRTAAPSSREPTLTWERYLQLRRSRRMAGLVTTIPTTLLAGVGSGSYFLTLELDSGPSIAGIEPLIIYGIATLACTGLGWLTGPTIGSSIWSLFHTDHARQIAAKDQDFYEHIKRNRVDPTRQSMQNPVPDYYGEKIGSLKQYRQWLRDQAAYRRKAAHGLEQDGQEI